MNHTTSRPAAQITLYPLVVCVDLEGHRVPEHERDIPEAFPYDDASEWPDWTDAVSYGLGDIPPITGGAPDDEESPFEPTAEEERWWAAQQERQEQTRSWLAQTAAWLDARERGEAWAGI
jgi:hypothetical protein